MEYCFFGFISMISTIVVIGDLDARFVSSCRISCDPFKHIVIVEEILENDGRSVTNLAAEICEIVLDRFGLDAGKLIYLEKSNYEIEDSWAIVKFSFDEKGKPYSPNGEYIEPAMLENIPDFVRQ